MNVKFLVVVLQLLSGCTTVQYRSAKMDSPSDGAMIVRVLPNMTGASQFFKNWQNITVARLPSHPGEKETQFAVTPTLDGTSRTAIYAGSLPPGSYRFVKFSAQQCGAMCINSWIEVNPQFSRFVIKSGHLTDLGVLVQASSPTDARSVLLAHDSSIDHGATTEIVRELVPGLNNLLAAPSLSWAPESVSSKMADLFAYTRTFSFGFVSPKEADNGNLIYGSANGVVYSWTPGQRAQAHDVGIRASVETALVTTAGSWFAGGELGMLQMSDDEGAQWRSIRGNLPFGVIVDLNQWREKVVATTLRGNHVYVHMADAGTNDWKLIVQYDMDVSSFWDVPGVRPQSFLIGDRLITTVPGRKVAYFDLSSGESATYSLPGAIQMFSVSQDGVLRCRCIAAIAVNPYESHDLGKTWQDSAASRFMLMPAFRDKMHGVAFKGGFFSPSKMAYTEDGGATWIETTETPVYFNQLFYSKDGNTAYAASVYGAFWTTRNDGKTWEALSR